MYVCFFAQFAGYCDSPSHIVEELGLAGRAPDNPMYEARGFI
jgi:hypothetical protein